MGTSTLPTSSFRWRSHTPSLQPSTASHRGLPDWHAFSHLPMTTLTFLGEPLVSSSRSRAQAAMSCLRHQLPECTHDAGPSNQSTAFPQPWRVAQGRACDSIRDECEASAGRTEKRSTLSTSRFIEKLGCRPGALSTILPP